MEEMRDDKIHVSESSLYFDPYLPFDEQFLAKTSDFLKDILSRVEIGKFERVIIIDDGGHLLSLSQEMFKGHKNIVGVEQTTSGYEKLRSMNLTFPVINVARSPAKLVYESPMIAEAVVKKIYKLIASLENNSKKILIIGNGAIGSALYTTLRNTYEVELYDHQENNRRITKENFHKELGRFDIVLGCTGHTCIPESTHPFLKEGCVLISVSSSDREFDSVHIRRKAGIISSCHDDVEANGIRLLNCGFPVNFDGRRHSVPPEKIQLTRALLAAGIFQAHTLRYLHPKIIPLDIDIQRDIVQTHFKLISENSFAIK
jgi:S-adenosylhomocysteine hydrolase